MARILVIDDSDSAVLKVKDVLGRAGYEVEGLELIIHLPNLVRTDPPDLILLDLSMPALSGINVASFIRRYQSRPIPIVLYSSRDADELAEVAMELGAVGFVQKGEPDGRMIAAVRDALGQRAQRI
jgi:CheY-like chemotaxis protein